MDTANGHQCARCRKSLRQNESLSICDNCQALYHASCWQTEQACVSPDCAARLPGSARNVPPRARKQASGPASDSAQKTNDTGVEEPLDPWDSIRYAKKRLQGNFGSLGWPSLVASAGTYGVLMAMRLAGIKLPNELADGIFEWFVDLMAPIILTSGNLAIINSGRWSMPRLGRLVPAIL